MLKKNGVHVYNTDPKNEEIFNQDFSKISDKHALIMYSKRIVVIAFADITKQCQQQKCNHT